ncbi:hypothetical protein [Candidatus Nitrosocosmicus sp. R]
MNNHIRLNSEIFFFAVIVITLSILPVAGLVVPNFVFAQSSPTPAASGGTESISVSQDKFGNIYLADGSSQTIKKYDSAGRFLQTIGSQGTSGNGTYSGALSLTTDVFGNVIVADSGNKLIQIFDGSGKLLTSFSFEDTFVSNTGSAQNSTNTNSSAPNTNSSAPNTNSSAPNTNSSAPNSSGSAPNSSGSVSL